MNYRINISSGAQWEYIVGYSRAVKIGNHIAVSGTTATDTNSNIVGINDYYAQTYYILQKIESALNQAGATMNHVIRTRIYVINIAHWQEVAKAHSEFFYEIKPATSMIEIKALIHPEMLVEIEADAFLN